VHPNSVSAWKQEAQAVWVEAFSKKRGRKAPANGAGEQALSEQIGRLQMELDGLKKKVQALPVMVRTDMIEAASALSIRRQCVLLKVPSGRWYAPAAVESAEDLELKRLLDEEYLRPPFYGSRRMTAYLRGLGWKINRKRVRQLLREMGLTAVGPRPNTRRRDKAHPVYPYLLRDVAIERVNQVWSADITYIPLVHGFAYRVAIVDWYSRKVLAWRLSNTLDAGLCVDCLRQALTDFGVPEIFNTDQGGQFTSEAFTGMLRACAIAISMDGRGRALDNVFVERLWRSVKYEDVYLQGYETIPELILDSPDTLTSTMKSALTRHSMTSHRTRCT
jgi:putative transposase